MPDVTERKRINNVIDSIRFVLDYFALDENVNYSDSDSEQDSFDSKFSDTRGEGLKILTPNQLFYSLYRSKKITKHLYKSLTDIIHQTKY